MSLLRSPLRSALRTPNFLPLNGKWGVALTGTILDLAYDIDFVAGTARGGTQPYGNNTNDGRLFRDPTNVVASFCPTVAAVGNSSLVSVAAAGIRRTIAGQWASPSFTNRALWNRDLTNAAWVSGGGGVTTAKTSIGADGSANACTRVTASGANATILQSITLASGQVVLSVDVKRITGTGNFDMTVDGGSTWTTKTITGSFTQQFITQAAVTNPVIGFRLVTSGDAIDVDFVHLITPANSMNVPKFERVATTSATVLNSQSRPSADIADLAPNSLINTARGAFAFYWQGRSQRPTGGFMLTGATGIFVSVDATSAGAVKFSANSGLSQTSAGVWKSDFSVNKVAGYFTSGGQIKVAANGTLGNLDTDATVEPALDHFDLATNGAGQNSIYGVTERFAIGPNITFTDAQLIAMTT